ncbi:MAG: hypothetical protein LBM93_15850 [Oscillospiraceae bacterium]|jgi:hypothetical protein|nr:hypothetical protein [Oscillospiraceae bacterium]
MDKVKEIIINEKSVYLKRGEQNTYRILEITYINDKRRFRTFAVEVENFKKIITKTERIDSFSNNLSETIDFVNMLINKKTQASCIFDEALSFLSLKINKLIA